MENNYTYKLKSIVALKLWLATKTDKDIEVIKGASKIHVLWAKGDKLYMEILPYSCIYTIPDHELDQLATSLQ